VINLLITGLFATFAVVVFNLRFLGIISQLKTGREIDLLSHLSCVT